MTLAMTIVKKVRDTRLPFHNSSSCTQISLLRPRAATLPHDRATVSPFGLFFAVEIAVAVTPVFLVFRGVTAALRRTNALGLGELYSTRCELK
jgi:hypothetical protein